MKREIKMRITVSKDEITLIKKMPGKAMATCPPCGRQVEMATPEQAVTLTGIHSRTIYGWVEGGLVHFIETADGHLLICLNSLRATHESPLQLQATESLGKLLLQSKTEEG
jgi:hypothetical protein